MLSGQLLDIPSSLTFSGVLGERFWIILVLLLFFFWIVSLLWVIKDASSRSDS
jgi:hypothetical protein